MEKQKLDLNLSAASSLSNIRIVNNATEALKVSPKFTVVLLSILILVFFYIYFLIDHLITDKILSIDSLLDFIDDRESFIGAFPQKEQTQDKNQKILDEIEKNNLDRSVISILNTKDKINIVTSMKGGVGKTYFCIKIFKKLSSLDKKVCIVDFDLRKKGLSFTKESNLPSEHFITFNDFEKSNEDFDSCIIKGPVTEDPIRFLSSQKINEFTDKLRKKFDFVLIDTPPLGTFVDAKLLTESVDSAVIILSSHLSTFGEIKTLKKELNASSNKNLEMKYFLNRVRYFLEIFKFKFKYPYYGYYNYYNYYDSYSYLNNEDNTVTFRSILSFIIESTTELKDKLLKLFRKK